MIIHLIKNTTTELNPKYEVSILRFMSDDERPFDSRRTELKDKSVQLDQYVVIDSLEKLDIYVERDWFDDFESYINFLNDSLTVLKEQSEQQKESGGNTTNA